MKLCGVDSEDLLDMVAEIRALSPKPAKSFSDNAAPPVTPDVMVRRAADGGWLVELNPGSLPRVLRQQHLCGNAEGRTPGTGEAPALYQRSHRCRQLAGARAAAARDHHPESGDGDRRASRANSSSAASAICGR